MLFRSAANTQYHIEIFSYNDCDGNPQYLTSSSVVDNFTTCDTPVNPPSGNTESNIGTTSATITWTMGAGISNSLILMSTALPDGTPVNGTTYDDDPVYSPHGGDNIDGTDYVMYNSTGTSVAVSGLTSGTEYFYKIFSFNECSGNPTYLTSSTTTGSFTACADPTGEPTGASVPAAGLGAVSADITWTLGTEATNTILVLSEASVTGDPVDATTYVADLEWNNGQSTLAAGEYVMYNNTSTTATITGLTAGTPYFYELFSFNDCEGVPQYYTSATTTGTFTTCDAPSITVSTMSSIDPSSEEVTLTWNTGSNTATNY